MSGHPACGSVRLMAGHTGAMDIGTIIPRAGAITKAIGTMRATTITMTGTTTIATTTIATNL